jgi:hypothetical protein
METFQEPVIVVDSDGNKGTVIGAMSVSMGGLNPAGIILANGLLLFGGSGVTGGPQRLSLLAEPGVINVSGDDGTTVRLDAGGSISINDGEGSRVSIDREGSVLLKDGQFSIVDTSDQTRLIADARGTLTLVDDSGNFTIALNAQKGSVSVNNSSPVFSSSVVLDAGNITLSDDSGNKSVLGASSSTFGSSVTFMNNIAVGGSAVFENVHVHGDVNVDGDVVLAGADCAEDFDIVGAALEPGTVVVIDETGGLTQSLHAYDTKVAGIVSGAGKHRPAIILDRQLSAEGRATIALIGKALCKVDADFSPIAVGDLLTTSDIPGHAMRADNPARAFGATLGKALQPLSSGRALIPVLVALQ